MKRNKYDIDYPKINAHYVEEDILEIETYPDEENHNSKVVIKIYDKDKTICDVIKHRSKIDKEVFNIAIRNYIKDNGKNRNNLWILHLKSFSYMGFDPYGKKKLVNQEKKNGKIIEKWV